MVLVSFGHDIRLKFLFPTHWKPSNGAMVRAVAVRRRIIVQRELTNNFRLLDSVSGTNRFANFFKNLFTKLCK